MRESNPLFYFTKVACYRSHQRGKFFTSSMVLKERLRKEIWCGKSVLPRRIKFGRLAGYYYITTALERRVGNAPTQYLAWKASASLLGQRRNYQRSLYINMPLYEW